MSGEETIRVSDLRASTKEAVEAGQRYTGQIHIRIPGDLHRELAELSEQQERSLNQQIVYLLKKALEIERRTTAREITPGSNIIQGNFGSHPNSMLDTKSRVTHRVARFP